jgi:hypothetical protein
LNQISDPLSKSAHKNDSIPYKTKIADKNRHRNPKHTGDTPISLRNNPDPRNNANASIVPIPAAKTNAEDTDDSSNLPELECLLAFLEMSSATNEVAMLNSGMLKILDTILKTDTPIPADASSRAPNLPIYAVSINCANGSIAWPRTAGRARRISSFLTPPGRKSLVVYSLDGYERVKYVMHLRNVKIIVNVDSKCKGRKHVGRQVNKSRKLEITWEAPLALH